MMSLNMNDVEQLLWFQNLLDVDLRELKEKPSHTKLASLVSDCEQYIKKVQSGELRLPVYLQRSQPEFWDK